MDRTIIYGLEYQARALCPHQGDGISFFVGTQNLKRDPTNQVHLINCDDEKITAKVFSHPFGEVWDLTSSPHDNRLLASCYNTPGNGATSRNQVNMHAAVFRIPEELVDDNVMPFDEVQDLKVTAPEVKTAAFHPTDSNSVAVVTDTKIHVVQLEGGGSRQVCELQGNLRFKKGKWAQHNHSNQFLALADNSIVSYDTREASKVAWTISGEQVFRDLDCNAHKQCHIVTGSDDGCIKIWDFRNVREPVFTRCDHSHWVWSVRYNTFHDQLILSSSSDARVNVTCAYSVSSEATSLEGGGVGDEEQKPQAQDSLLESLDYHDDSVYCAEWSLADPWSFASLSYDGRFVFRKLSKEIKYKVLL